MMIRRKGESAGRMNERDYPHLVELPLPPAGFGSTSEDMVAFHRERGIQIWHGRGRSDQGRFFVTYCFADSAHADAYRARFVGERLSFKRSDGVTAPTDKLRDAVIAN